MAEVARIIRALPAKVRVLGRLLAETGCRRGEAFNLRWDDVDLKQGLIHIRSKEGWTPKTALSERTIPIGQELQSQLQQMAKQNASAKEKNSDYVFPGNDPRKPITHMRRAWASTIKKVAITRNGKPLRITPHTFRKAYATWAAIEKGLPPRLLQALLGHAPGSTVTDQYYVGVPTEALRKGINELEV
jgi:integrase